MAAVAARARSAAEIESTIAWLRTASAKLSVAKRSATEVSSLFPQASKLSITVAVRILEVFMFAILKEGSNTGK